MPNLYNNAGFEPDEATSDDNLSALGFHEDGDDLERKLESELGELDSDEEDEDLDLDEDEDVDTQVAAPIFNALADKILTAADEDEEEAEETDLVASEDDYEESADDSVVVSKEKIILARQLLENIRKSSERLNTLFSGMLSLSEEDRINISEISDGLIEDVEEDTNVVEGVFNGENMIGPDGKEYSVPANYASKSKLVEGDMLKLTITDRGTFLYKQTKPVERKRLIGKLEKDANGNYEVSAEHKRFRVITASVTYYKGVPGDKVVVLVPVSGDSAWGAVENVIKNK
jgi:signal transduction histidine kinase